MNSRRRDSRADDIRRATTSRRTLLIASGAVAIGALSGCLNRVASSLTSTKSSPAAVFAGVGGAGGKATFPGFPHVARLTPTLAERVELEGWVTSSALTTANYNNSRSNKSKIRAPDGDADSDADGVDDDVRGEDYNSPRSNRSIARPSDLFDDDIDEDDETFRVVSRLDAQLQEATTAAATAISKRSARTGRNPETGKEITEALDDMEAVLAEMRAVLERCSDDSCVAALENVADREADVRRVQEYSAWDAYETDGKTEDAGNGLLAGGYLLPPVVFDPLGLFSPTEQVELYRYLEQGPVVAEQFSVCLPDSEVPGGDRSIREEVTPERLIAYLTDGDGGGKVYSWGSSHVAADGSGDCDDDDPSTHPGAVCGTTPHFVAEVTGPVATGGGLRSVRTDVEVIVVNDPPSAETGASVLVCPVDGEAYEPTDLSEWGSESGASSETPIIVCQVMVQPPRCPEPVPALLYLKRCQNDGQFIYSGGWIIDDAALYENSATVLSMVGSTPVVGIELGDLDSDGDGVAEVVERRRRTRGRIRYNSRKAQIVSGTIDELVEREVLSKEGGDHLLLRKKPGRREKGDDDESGENYRFGTHVAVDAPMLHLVNAASASNEVKFKAGAELSKSVN